MKYQIPGTSYQVEVYTYQPSNEDKNARTVVIVRDLSQPSPEFNALTYLKDLDSNIIHQEWIDADTTPTP